MSLLSPDWSSWFSYVYGSTFVSAWANTLYILHVIIIFYIIL